MSDNKSRIQILAQRYVEFGVAAGYVMLTIYKFYYPIAGSEAWERSILASNLRPETPTAIHILYTVYWYLFILPSLLLSPIALYHSILSRHNMQATN